MRVRPRNKIATTIAVATMETVVGGSGLESSDGSLRDTVTGDENSPPPTLVTAWI